MSTEVVTTATLATAVSGTADGQRRVRLVDRMKFRPPSSAATTRAQPPRHRTAPSKPHRAAVPTSDARRPSSFPPLPLEPTTPPKRAPPRQRRRKVPVKFRRLAPSPSPTPDRRNVRSGAPAASATAAAPSRLGGQDDAAAAAADDDESSDQHSSPIGTFGALPSRLSRSEQGKHEPVQPRLVRSSKRRRLELIPTEETVDEHRQGDNSADIDISDISCFPTLAAPAPAELTANITDARRGDDIPGDGCGVDLADATLLAQPSDSASVDRSATTDATSETRPRHRTGAESSTSTSTSSKLSRPPPQRHAQIARIDYLVAATDDTEAALRAERQATRLLRSHIDPQRWTFLTDSALRRRASLYRNARRVPEQPDRSKIQLRFRQPPFMSASVRRDFVLPASTPSYRDVLPEWSSQPSPAEEGSLLEFQSHLRPATCYAGYASAFVAAAKRASALDTILPAACLDVAILLVPASTWRSQLSSPRTRYEIVKIVVPISDAACYPAASDAIWLDAVSPLPSTTQWRDGAKTLAWLPGTFSRFQSSLDHLSASSTKAQEDRLVLGYTVLRHPGGLPRQVTLYVTLERLDEARAWLASLEIDGLGTRPFRTDRGGDGAKVVVIDAKGTRLLVF